MWGGDNGKVIELTRVGGNAELRRDIVREEFNLVFLARGAVLKGIVAVTTGHPGSRAARSEFLLKLAACGVDQLSRVLHAP